MKGELQFYAFICPEHGLVEDYPHGYRQVLQCPLCRSGSWIYIINPYLRAKTVKYSQRVELPEARG